MNYNKLPFKERKRHYDYQYNQTERQERILIEREIKRAEEEKLMWLNECETNDKAQLEKEMIKRLMEIKEREQE